MSVTFAEHVETVPEEVIEPQSKATQQALRFLVEVGAESVKHFGGNIPDEFMLDMIRYFHKQRVSYKLVAKYFEVSEYRVRKLHKYWQSRFDESREA